MATKPTYQQLSRDLDAILAQLQSGDLDIDEALIAYDKGQKIIAQLQAHLDAAENKVKKVSPQTT
jgi:exodeoxyribonuclease VII small subunit